MAPDAKVEARGRGVEAVKAGGFGPREVVIRIKRAGNAVGRRRSGRRGFRMPDAILVPKVQDPDQLVSVGRRLEALGTPSTTRIWAMIETPIAILDIHAIAAARKSADAAGRVRSRTPTTSPRRRGRHWCPAARP